MQIIHDRSAQIYSVSGQGLITLTRASGDTVRLDAAVVIQMPDRARVRAWKFGQAVFDLTLTPDGLWVIPPKDKEQRDQIMAAGANVGNLMREWLSLMGGMLDGQVEERGERLTVTQARGDGSVLTCEVDRRTLTPRKYVLKDAGGLERFTLDLKQYLEVSGTVWPGEIEARSATGTIHIELRDVEVNGEIPAGAFHPPARAEKLQ